MIGPEQPENYGSPQPPHHYTSIPPIQQQDYARTSAPKYAGLESIFTSNQMMIMAIMFGFFLVFIGGIVMRLGGYDAMRAAAIIIQLGLVIIISSLLPSAIFRNDLHVAIRLGILAFVIVISYCLILIAYGR